MAEITYASVALAFAILATSFFFITIQNSVDKIHLLRTPSIPLEKAVITSVVSTRIRASADEVFATVTKFRNTSEISPISNFEWTDKSRDGVPHVGSTGRCRLSIDGFPSKILPLKLTVLDPKSRKIAYLSTQYPPWLLESERVIEIVPVKDHPNTCDYRSYQTWEGTAAYYLLLTARWELAEAENRVAEDLRLYVERGHR